MGDRDRKRTRGKTDTHATHFSPAKRDSSRIVAVRTITRFITRQMTVDFTCACRNYRNTLYARTTAAANRLCYVSPPLASCEMIRPLENICVRISVARIQPCNSIQMKMPMWTPERV